MKKKTLSMVIALTMLLAALLAGCQQGSDSKGDGDSGDSPVETALSAGELSVWADRLKAEVQSEGTEGEFTTSEVNGFFLSDWADPRQLDFYGFISYFPMQTQLKNGDEGYTELMAAYEEKHGEPFNGEVPIHAIPVAAINAALTKYAGITVDDLTQDWKNGEAYIYLPEYDTVYTFVSDYGPGVFVPTDGCRQGDVLILNSFDHTLTIRETGDDWQMVSFLPKT